MQSALLYAARRKCHNWDSNVYEEEEKEEEECDEQRNESFLVNRERARGLFVCKIQYNKPTNERTIFRLDLLVLFLLLLPMLPNYHEWQKKIANF
jgi:hypothetical protein